jgi:unspecific monooxygenase
MTDRALRATLGRFATGVAVATARHADGRPCGLTINSFASVSLDPPLVLWSLASAAASLAVFRAARFHAINVLAAAQAALSRRFSARDVDRFHGVAWRGGPFGTVLLDGALAHIVCRPRELREVGDHTMLLSDVVFFRDSAGDPLVFHAGQYWTTATLADRDRPGTGIAARIAGSSPSTKESPMPIYEYTCNTCGQEFETLVRSGAAPDCPSCRSTDLAKKLSVFATASAADTVPIAAGPCGTCGHPDGPGSCALN